MSPEMNSYLMDLSELRVRDEDLNGLWASNLVAVLPPGPHEVPGPKDRWTLHRKQQRWAMKAFLALSKHGGYVWIEAPDPKGVKVGRVEPGTEPEDLDVVLTDPPVPRLGDNLATKLKTLALTDVRELAPDEAMDLRSERRPGGSFDRWTECGPRLAALIEGSPVERTWGNLRPELRLAVCAEFLRHHRDPHYPRLARLLLPASDRDPGMDDSGPYHADIYGLAEDGTEVFAQVPLADDNMKYNMRMGRKVKALHGYARGDRSLICFWDFRSALLGYNDVPKPFVREGVQFVTVEEVLHWVEEQPTYAEKVFSV